MLISLALMLASSIDNATNIELAILSRDEDNIRAKLISIQTTLTPHMEILHKELGYVETLMKKDQIFLHYMA